MINRYCPVLPWVAVFSLCVGAFAGSQTYTPDNTDFANPERGWFHQWSLSESSLRTRRIDDKITVVRKYCRLDSYRTSPIAQISLDSLDDGLAAARRAGVKVIPLFSYNFGTDGAGGSEDATLTQVLAHIDQVAPILNKHYDVVACWDAGFIGAWGEWHSSGHNIDDIDSMRIILFAELDALVTQRMVCVRVNTYKRGIFETDDPLTPETAFQQTRISRTGHKNDCLGASLYDWGTYAWNQDPWIEKDYLRAENQFLPQFGETCNVSEWSVCDSMLRDLNHMRWDVLNMDYHQEVVQSWKDDGCYDEVCRRLGYRFELYSAQFDDTAVPGQNLTGQLRLANVGFGKAFNPRGCDVVLRPQGGGDEIRLPVDTDVRRWLADDDTITVDIDATVPGNAALGVYDALLHFPDTATNATSGQRELMDRPEYSIRLASDGVWEESTGYNDLDLTVAVSTSSQVTRPIPEFRLSARDAGGTIYTLRGERTGMSLSAPLSNGVYLVQRNGSNHAFRTVKMNRGPQ